MEIRILLLLQIPALGAFSIGKVRMLFMRGTAACLCQALPSRIVHCHVGPVCEDASLTFQQLVWLPDVLMYEHKRTLHRGKEKRTP